MKGAHTYTSDHKWDEEPCARLDHLEDMIPCCANEEEDEKNGATHTGVIAIECEVITGGIPGAQHFWSERKATASNKRHIRTKRAWRKILTVVSE